jgi:hypothetical protein
VSACDSEQAKLAQNLSKIPKHALKRMIQDELSQHRINEEFEFALLSDLIAAKHYYCSIHELRPMRFRKGFRAKYGGDDYYDFEGFFPGIGWHKVSWNQCLHRRGRDERFKRALRERIKPIIHRYRLAHPVCEVCGDAPSEMSMLSESDKDDLIKAYDWTIDEEFQLPESCPAIQYILKEHETASFWHYAKRATLILARLEPVPTFKGKC